MSIGMAANIMQSGVFQVLLVAAPMLIIAVTVGLVISIFQATTSIQEQPLPSSPRLLQFWGVWPFSVLGCCHQCSNIP